MDPADTKTRLLDAAERVFGEQGFAAASLRAITAEAGVNLAAANYHFGSKELLYLAMFQRRVAPMNARRLAGLDRLEQLHGERQLPLEPVLEAFLRPALELARDPDAARFLRVIGRMHAEGDELCRKLEQEFETVKRRYLAALQRALPELPLTELWWRAHFMLGAMFHTMNDGHRLCRVSSGLCDTSDVDAVLERLVPYAAAGFHAPLPADAAKEASS